MRNPVHIPTGTVTLLFTDIEGSTRLWEAEPEAMTLGLRRHDEILRTSIELAGGYVFKTIGDAFCAAFSTAEAALDAVLAAQRALVGQDSPTTQPILVRMGLHTGACEERDNDYFGPAVNRVARLESRRTRRPGPAVRCDGGAAVAIATGRRDAARPRYAPAEGPGPSRAGVPAGSGLPAGQFPPLASLDNPDLPNNLPGQLSAFIGRERELAEVRSLAASARLVTLTGSGGSGKTRLALQAAVELLDVALDGVWFADLAVVTDGAQVPGAVAAALELPDHSGPAVLASILEVLTGQDAVILLDNCEHVIDDAARFCEQVIRYCPRVRFLATSREPLGIEGERVYRVPSLSLPPRDAISAADLAGSDSVTLFVERARSHEPGFMLDDAAAPLVATICRRLDGIPLALELAAARLSSMSLRHLSERLDQRFRLLTGGSRNALPRQQTLQATVDWSFDLLSVAEREAMRRLSVFAGGFELEAAEAICAAGVIDALDVLGSWWARSLTRAWCWLSGQPWRAASRCATDCWRPSGSTRRRSCSSSASEDELTAIRDRHAAFYLRVGQEAGPALTGRRKDTGSGGSTRSGENLRAAFGHLARRRPDRRRTEARHVAPAIRCQPGTARGSELPARGCRRRRFGCHRAGRERAAGDIPAAGHPAPGRSERQGRGQGLRRTWPGHGGDPGRARPRARALGQLSEIVFTEGDLGRVRELASEAVAIARTTGDRQLLGEMLRCLAAAEEQSAPENRRLRAEALDCFRQSGDELWPPTSCTCCTRWTSRAAASRRRGCTWRLPSPPPRAWATRFTCISSAKTWPFCC